MYPFPPSRQAYQEIANGAAALAAQAAAAGADVEDEIDGGDEFDEDEEADQNGEQWAVSSYVAILTR